MDTDILKNPCAGRVPYNLKMWLHDVRIHTDNKPFIYRELPEELKSKKCFRQATAREYIQKYDKVMYKNQHSNVIYRWVIV